MNIDERYYSPNMHRVEKLMPKYSDFIDEYVAVLKTFGRYTGINGMTPEENAIIVEVVKTQYLIEVSETLNELHYTVSKYSDERNGILVAIKDNILEDDSIRAVAETLYDTNSRIDDLRQTVDNLFSDRGHSILHELTYDLKNKL